VERTNLRWQVPRQRQAQGERALKAVSSTLEKTAINLTKLL